MKFLSDEFIVYRKILTDYKIKKKTFILLGFYLVELETTSEEILLSGNSNTSYLKSENHL